MLNIFDKLLRFTHSWPDLSPYLEFVPSLKAGQSLPSNPSYLKMAALMMLIIVILDLYMSPDSA